MKNRSKILMAILPVLACFALLPGARAVSPAPDGCYPNYTTAEGCNALQFLGGGFGNTGVGWYSLYLAGDSNFNTGVGGGALALNNGDSNTAVGAAALLLNTTGTLNTAVGTDALVYNDSGSANNAVGAFALFNNTTGDGNVAIGYFALSSNSTSGINTTDGTSVAVGYQALENNTAEDNDAVGHAALQNNTTGRYNNAMGWHALISNTTGESNTAVGDDAGSSATTGSGNVYLGATMTGVAGESNACYIRSIFSQTSASGIPVLINSSNKLGTTTSSKRFKEDIKPMDKASEALFELKPVSFRYKKELDPAGIPQFGLVAEDVQKVDAALVVLDKEGKPYTVRYDQVNVMLLNEFLKEHKKVEEQQASIAQLKSTVAQQQKGMEVVTAQLKEQASQIQKVSAQLEMSKPATKVVVNKP
jgi:trimeric autotransporter adhesin